MTDSRTQLSWAPSAEASKRILFYLGIVLVLIGAIAFGLSFDSVMVAARPVFHAAAWAVPVLMDATLAVLTFTGLILELNGLRARLPQYFARVLIGLTIYANVAPAHGVFARILHGAPPTVWAVLVMIAESTVRKLVGLAAENRIEGIRRSLWFLRPAATLRLWRRMRIHQIATYREALDVDGARAAVVGRLRLHYGRMWRWNAPLAERIALRLEGRDPAGIGEILRTHTDTAALLSGTYLEPAPEAVPEVVPEQVPEVSQGDEQDLPKPRPRRTQGRGKKPARGTGLRRTEPQLLEAAQALNQQAIAETGTAVSLRALKSGLRVGQPTAERIRAKLIGPEAPAIEPVPVADSEPVSAVAEYGVAPVLAYLDTADVEYVNGHDLEAVAARL